MIQLVVRLMFVAKGARLEMSRVGNEAAKMQGRCRFGEQMRSKTQGKCWFGGEEAAKAYENVSLERAGVKNGRKLQNRSTQQENKGLERKRRTKHKESVGLERRSV